MIITLTGMPGSGKTTIGKRLAERLGYEFFSIGTLRREMAKQRGMTIEEFNLLGRTDPSTDGVADEYQRTLGLEKDNMVVDSKVGFYFIPNSVKLFITADETERAKRIFYDKSHRNQQSVANIEEQKLMNAKRVENDNFRYKKHYGLDYVNEKNYDLVLDTTKEHDIDKIVDKIIDFLKSKKHF